MASPFQHSPNVLFETRVDAVERLSPAFLRIRLAGSGLHHVTPRGLDQRLKILLPVAGHGWPEELLAGQPEHSWRRRWRAVAADRRPVLRSYTVSASRPERAELDLDMYCHASPGPASRWAQSTRAGETLFLSAPDHRLDRGQGHGVQWRPGSATRVLLAGDETAFPAIAGIASALPSSVRAEIVLETGDLGDIDWVREVCTGPGRSVEIVHREPRQAGGAALVAAVHAWVGAHGAAARELGDRFYAWSATESQHVARLREELTAAGIARRRVHAQGYWNDRPRPLG
ncbi:siderophore-interacting protein [Ruania alba]|uniref:NADPH-dependent ferric siderophore reductase, contains FAD-binding and SIP domains n=1 Tax=Ruania alba TaxID=648782 RepID=A0A1H5DZG3_9MICO|nr:siderophore-interacting protein [Ruania alba]SED84232.1 NADPH-dependent ferric siderophore reductase, contains FAD-binding and SIP domains [Ruania alba]